MSTIEQDALLGSLIRQKKEFQRERSAISITLAGYSSKLSKLADLIANDKYHALATLKDIDTAKLNATLDDFFRVDSALAQCERDIAAINI